MPDIASLKEAVLRLAESCRYEKGHTQQVVRLSLRLFDELRPLHGLGFEERALLEAGAWLHDIGWIKGGQGHHKTGRDIIVSDSDLPLEQDQKIMVALIVRYHRGALPKPTHRYYADLPVAAKSIVRKCAAMLRVADGLDRRHVSAVNNISCEILSEIVNITIESSSFSEEELHATQKKADLFVDVFGKPLAIIYKGELVRKI